MELIYRSSTDYKISNWAGGTTTEAFIFPEDGSYVDRDFIFRLSSANCLQEKSIFSKLDGYNRLLWILEGQLTLVHNGSESIKLNPFEKTRFSGGYKTESFGKAKDYNIIAADDTSARGRIINLEAQGISTSLDEEKNSLKFESYDSLAITLFSNSGYCIANTNGDTTMIKEGDHLIILLEKDEVLDFSLTLMGEGMIIMGTILYENPKNLLFDSFDSTCEDSSSSLEKHGFSKDFRTCFYLVNTNFRGAKYIFKKRKFLVYDKALNDSINKIEGIYITTFLPIIAALLPVLFINYMSKSTLIWAIALSVAICVLLLNPLLYYLASPKPVSKHLLDIRKLSEAQIEKLLSDRKENRNIERILKKYKFSGRYYYDENGNRIDNFH